MIAKTPGVKLKPYTVILLFDRTQDEAHSIIIRKTGLLCMGCLNKKARVVILCPSWTLALTSKLLSSTCPQTDDLDCICIWPCLWFYLPAYCTCCSAVLALTTSLASLSLWIIGHHRVDLLVVKLFKVCEHLGQSVTPPLTQHPFSNKT